jgi:phospholipase C
MFVITYDEWGGFFDHVAPPVVPDGRASSDDRQNFGQAGFRVPTIVASPYARRGFVDHRLYDHTSIIRFIEWRFLGAPPEGADGSGWYLTQRDRYARNLGWSLLPERPDPEVDVDELPKVPVSSAPCRGEELDNVPIPAPDHEKHAFEIALEDGVFERLGFDIDLKPLPV